jgi:ketosteroid isomerase-like protein
MDELLAAARIVACQQAIHRFYAALDASDFATVAAAVAPDGVWHRQGKALRGPGDVAAALAERPAGRVTAHLVQNLVVTLEDPETATARYNTLVFRHDGAAGAPLPAPIGVPLSIAAAQDRLRRDAATGSWLVVERRSSRVFGA